MSAGREHGVGEADRRRGGGPGPTGRLSNVVAGLFVGLLSWGLMTTCRAAAPPDDMAARMQACEICHGAEGRASSEGYLPRIAGKPAAYLFNQLVNFRDGRRRNAAMSHLLVTLDDAYLADMAAYFAALELPYPAPAAETVPAATLAHGETLVRQGDPARKIPACRECHGNRLTGLLPATPGLLGLPRDYLVAQLGAWQQGHRRAVEPDCMAKVAGRLDGRDIAAVAAWLAAQPVPRDARAVIRDSHPPLDCGSAAR